MISNVYFKNIIFEIKVFRKRDSKNFNRVSNSKSALSKLNKHRA